MTTSYEEIEQGQEDYVNGCHDNVDYKSAGYSLIFDFHKKIKEQKQKKVREW